MRASGALLAWRSLSGDAVQNFSVLPFDTSLIEVFGGRNLRSLQNTSNWLKFPKPDSSDKCHKQEAEN